MSEHRSILEKLTRLRDQLPTTQLTAERAQELLDALNEHWFAEYLGGQRALLELVEDYANGRQPDEALLHEATKPPTAEERRLEIGRFWAEVGGWRSAAEAMDCTEAEAKVELPDLARAHKDQKLWIDLLNAKAMDLCQRSRKSKPIQPKEELPEEAKKLPKKYQKDRRRYGAGWGV